VRLSARAGGEDAMQRIRKTIELKASPQRVYDYLTQPANLPSIWPSLMDVSNIMREADGSHEFDWIYKMAGVHFKGHAKTEEVQPGKLIRARTQGGIPATYLWTFEGLDGSGTKLMMEVEYSIPAPVLGKLAEVLVAKTNEREHELLLLNLKEVMESTAAASAPAHAPH
jgi:uncharacterized membrane protein